MQIQTIGLVLMSVAVLQYGVVPLIADLNATHALNPRSFRHSILFSRLGFFAPILPGSPRRQDRAIVIPNMKVRLENEYV